MGNVNVVSGFPLFSEQTAMCGLDCRPFVNLLVSEGFEFCSWCLCLQKALSSLRSLSTRVPTRTKSSTVVTVPHKILAILGLQFRRVAWRISRSIMEGFNLKHKARYWYANVLMLSSTLCFLSLILLSTSTS